MRGDSMVRWIATGIILIIAFIIIVEATRNVECNRNGGQMVGTGNYSTVTTFTADGSPIIVTSEETKCVKR
jgi:hypothetical protein